MQLLDRLLKDIVTESENFEIEAFMPLLGERIYVSNPFSRQFLVGWIATLDSVRGERHTSPARPPPTKLP